MKRFVFVTATWGDVQGFVIVTQTKNADFKAGAEVKVTVPSVTGAGKFHVDGQNHTEIKSQVQSKPPDSPIYPVLKLVKYTKKHRDENEVTSSFLKPRGGGVGTMMMAMPEGDGPSTFSQATDESDDLDDEVVKIEDYLTAELDH